MVIANSGFSSLRLDAAQHSTVPPANFIYAGTRRALVWVFDANNIGSAMGGSPATVLEFLADTPRALAVSEDGSRVFAAAYRSGNRTTVIRQDFVTAGGGSPPPPPGSAPDEPPNSLIVKFNPQNGAWEDEIGRDWRSDVRFDLPDFDLFVIDANANPPTIASGTNNISGVGTVLFNMAVRPGTNKVYVSNIEHRNHIRFENLVGTTQGLQAHFAENRISVVNGGQVNAVHLNPHIDYSVPTGPAAERNASLAQPLDMVFTSDGQRLYVTAFGSGKVAVLRSDLLEAGQVDQDHIAVPGGPSGLALDESRNRLYVISRFDQKITVIGNPASSQTRSVIDTVTLPTPEPVEIVSGRPLLYDAKNTSGHGDSACGTCHLFGDMDKLAWDLGNPFGSVEFNPNPSRGAVRRERFPPHEGAHDHAEFARTTRSGSDALAGATARACPTRPTSPPHSTASITRSSV